MCRCGKKIIGTFCDCEKVDLPDGSEKIDGMKHIFPEEAKADRESQKNKKDLLDDILKPVDSLNVKELDIDLPEKKPKIIKYPYKSKDGFITTKINRGYQEIKYLVDLIKDNNLNCFILGGYVRYMCSSKRNPYPAADVDVYSYSDDDYKKLHELLKSHDAPGRDLPYIMTVKHENEVSITFNEVTDTKHPLHIAPAIQLIKPLNKGAMVLKGDMETVLKNFDFTVVRCGLINENECMVDADFHYDESKGLLRLKCIHCPISSTLRCVKYGKKGYWMTPIESLKLFLDWDSRDEEYRMELIEMVQKFEKEGVTESELDELEKMMRID